VPQSDARSHPCKSVLSLGKRKRNLLSGETAQTVGPAGFNLSGVMLGRHGQLYRPSSRGQRRFCLIWIGRFLETFDLTYVGPTVDSCPLREDSSTQPSTTTHAGSVLPHIYSLES
jgi:hypothetical protein